MEMRQNVLLKLSYLGFRYSGFAYQPGRQTVEYALLQALYRSHMLPGIEMLGRQIFDEQKQTIDHSFMAHVSSLQYQKCGRTDAGVSASGQCISLFLKSRRSVDDGQHRQGRLLDEGLTEAGIEKDESARIKRCEEYPYDTILNSLLPEDIRVRGWTGVGKEFGARFSCTGREYEYLFFKGGLDIDRMRRLAKKVEGKHWFGRLSKREKESSKERRRGRARTQKLGGAKGSEDAEEAVRTVDSAEILFQKKAPEMEDEVYVLRIRARSFLHNQVRKIFSLLELAGKGREIEMDEVFDREKETGFDIPLASPAPLVLKRCFYDGITEESLRSSGKKRDRNKQTESARRVYIRGEVERYVLGPEARE
jgi:tRNA pseudouridine38/39 synthase